MKIELEKIIKEAVVRLGKDQSWPENLVFEVQIERPANLDFGDYSTNVALQLAKQTKQNPTVIAEQIKDTLVKNLPSYLSKVETVGGFINFYLSSNYLLDEVQRVIKEKDKFGGSSLGKNKTIIIDYSAPNIAKPFGIGHLRSTIIGQAIYNLYQFLGYKVIGDNHLGDWGTQFGKLIYQIKIKDLDVKKLTIEELEKIYIDFHQQAKDNPQLEEEARTWFKKLEDGDRTARKIWQACKDLSLKEFDRIYNLLGVKIDYALGESFYEKKMASIFAEAKKKGLAKQSEGAWIIEFPPEKKLPSLVLIKSNGGTTYFLRDLATFQYRLKKWKPAIIIYEVGVDQSLHFRQLFRTVEMLGWAENIKLVHIAHGLMRSKTGKFSTRKGETIHLEDVLNEAIEKAQEIIEQSETDKGLSVKEKEALTKQVGIGAIKYNDLSQHYSRDIIFDWDKILNLKGNSGPYLQYTYARCQSVLQKSPVVSRVRDGYQNLNEEELKILRQLAHFSETIQESAFSFSPNAVCNYIFDLAQDFNLFYAKHSILQSGNEEQTQFRLALTAGVEQVIKNGLTLLGIEAPERM